MLLQNMSALSLREHIHGLFMAKDVFKTDCSRQNHQCSHKLNSGIEPKVSFQVQYLNTKIKVKLISLVFQ